ncbi:type III polyketide synthase [Sphingomonas sp. MMS24-J13]|uniref:type III polyketide synthase n=1 Tax=Sphingomonas sp. MMS24-J13 TaxID=3238686 RepID=UPI00384EE3A9
MPSQIAHINRIGTAVPDHDVHQIFQDWASSRLPAGRDAALFLRMAQRCGIEHRWSVLPPSVRKARQMTEFYAGTMPSTAARMAIYAREAPVLALAAIGALGDLGTISHLVVASCTGFVAPGIDQIIARELGLDGSVERTLVGFMGCYAAVAALRVAHHIVRSEPAARVLVVTVELSTLHLQGTCEIEALLAQLQFGDGAAAAIVSGEKTGLALDRFVAATLPDSADLIRWTIGDEGFRMHLSGAVPNRIAEALGDPATRAALIGDKVIDGWAVHTGGRSVLDAVERAIDLPPEALGHSRAVLADNGNMSSATLMFVLERFLKGPPIENGIALAFGPGLAAEGFRFRGTA